MGRTISKMSLLSEKLDFKEIRIPKDEIIQELKNFLDESPEQIPINDLESVCLAIIRKNILKRFNSQPQTVQKFQAWITSYKEKRKR